MSIVTSAASVGSCLLAGAAVLNARRLRDLPEAPASRMAPMVSVLIPARNEAPSITACLEAVLASTGVVLEVLVLDDESSDDTAARVAAVAMRDRRVRLLHGRPIPNGWLGKPYACQQLAEAATGTLLAFVDADVVLESNALGRSAALLEMAELDLVSPYPRQVAVSPAERLIQPLLQWSWLTFLPLRQAENSRMPALTAANGQLLVCRRSAYRTAGGHGVVRDAVLDDVELARAFKRAGLRVALADGTGVATCRMYRGWGEVRDGYSKSLHAVARRPAGRVGIAAVLLWLYVLPPAAAVRRITRRGEFPVVPVLGYIAGVAGRVVAARRTGGRSTDAVAHPLSILLAVGLGLRSTALRRAGRLSWKDRPLP